VNLEAIRERWAAASPPPWHAEIGRSPDGHCHGAPVVYDAKKVGFVARVWKSHPRKVANAEAIAAAPADIAALLALVASLRASRAAGPTVDMVDAAVRWFVDLRGLKEPHVSRDLVRDLVSTVLRAAPGDTGGAVRDEDEDVKFLERTAEQCVLPGARNRLHMIADRLRSLAAAPQSRLNTTAGGEAATQGEGQGE
jgi:hypothetical protein